MNGAGAALADPATKFCPDEFKMVTEDPEEGRVRGDIHLAGLAVNLKGELAHSVNKRVLARAYPVSRRCQSRGLMPYPKFYGDWLKSQMAH